MSRPKTNPGQPKISDLRSLLRAIEADGGYEKRRHKHIVMCCADTGKIVSIPRTTSDVRSLLNCWSDWKKAKIPG